MKLFTAALATWIIGLVLWMAIITTLGFHLRQAQAPAPYYRSSSVTPS